MNLVPIQGRCLWSRFCINMLCLLLVNILARFVLVWITIVQWFFVISRGQPNGCLKDYTAYINAFCYHSMQYLTFNCDHCPFPLDEMKRLSTR